MTQPRWDRRDGSGKLSARRQKEYERAGISREQYEQGYRLTHAIIPPRGKNNVTEWPRRSLEQVIVLQWSVISELERKLSNGKR